MPYPIYYEAPYYFITIALCIGIVWKPNEKTVLLCLPYLVINFCMLFYGGILADEYNFTLCGYEILISALNFILYIILCIRSVVHNNKTSV